MRFLIYLSLLILLISCKTKSSDKNYENEILNVEAEFAKMVLDEGLTKAFLHYADEEAVLNRENKLIKGKDAINEYLKANPVPPGSKLEWTPDHIDVSQSGDLAYTYGQFTFSLPDSTGLIQESKGVFHTVWKKQEDGSWKYVWD